MERLRDQLRRIRECAFDDDVVAVLEWDDGEVIPTCISDIQDVVSEGDQPLGEKPPVTRDDLLAQGPW